MAVAMLLGRMRDIAAFAPPPSPCDDDIGDA